MSLNPDLIRARCVEIDTSLSRLEEIARLPRETFLSNQDTLDVACYRLLIAIEAALALCFHVSQRNDYITCLKNMQVALLRWNRQDLSPRIFPAACSRWHASEICSFMCIGRSTTGRCMRSLRLDSKIYGRSARPWLA